jgi:hypothetical protein
MLVSMAFCPLFVPYLESTKNIGMMCQQAYQLVYLSLI